MKSYCYQLVEDFQELTLYFGQDLEYDEGKIAIINKISRVYHLQIYLSNIINLLFLTDRFFFLLWHYGFCMNLAI